MIQRRALGALAGFGLLAAVPFLAACQRDAGQPPLAGATMGGPFTLTDQDGRRVSDTAFAGKYRLIYFGYSYCPDVCPTDLALIGAGLRRFEASDPARAARVQPIFISVDPARDTPPVLKRYVAAFHPRLIGLTGSEAEIARVAREYAVYYHAQPPAPGAPANAYLVDHSRTIVLYDPRGRPMAILPDDQGPDGIANALDRWVR
jgi:protein SCO1/2